MGKRFLSEGSEAPRQPSVVTHKKVGGLLVYKQKLKVTQTVFGGTVKCGQDKGTSKPFLLQNRLATSARTNRVL